LRERLLATFGEEEFGAPQAARALGVDADAMRRDLHALTNCGLAELVEEGKGRRAHKWRLGRVGNGEDNQPGSNGDGEDPGGGNGAGAEGEPTLDQLRQRIEKTFAGKRYRERPKEEPKSGRAA
jgi:hypothetical protein